MVFNSLINLIFHLSDIYWLIGQRHSPVIPSILEAHSPKPVIFIFLLILSSDVRIINFTVSAIHHILYCFWFWRVFYSHSLLYHSYSFPSRELIMIVLPRWHLRHLRIVDGSYPRFLILICIIQQIYLKLLNFIGKLKFFLRKINIGHHSIVTLLHPICNQAYLLRLLYFPSFLLIQRLVLILARLAVLLH